MPCNWIPGLAWVAIEKELITVGTIEARDIWDINHVEFVVSGVKISFYVSAKSSPITAPINLKDNIWLADIEAIGAMKMEVMFAEVIFEIITIYMLYFKMAPILENWLIYH